MRHPGLRRALMFGAAVLLLSLLLPACGGGDDDDAGPGDGEPEAAAHQPAGRAARTAHDDFLEADDWVARGIYSTALLVYEEAVDKLIDDDPRNDGPDAALTLDRSRYGAALCLTTIPLKIIEGFVNSFLIGDMGAITGFIIEDYQRRTGDADPPTNLLTIYIRDWILPELAEANDRLDAVLGNPDFHYDLPTLRFTLFETAIAIPDVAGPGERGRHDLVEASLLSMVLHAAEWLMRSALSYNIDIDIARIDDILWLIREGHFDELVGMVNEYPGLLLPSTDETNGIDGRAMLLAAYEDFAAMLLRLRDDDDQDGSWNPAIGPDEFDLGEAPDDLMDALWLDRGHQLWDVIPRTDRGLGLNVRLNGQGMSGSAIEEGINFLLTGLLTNDVMSMVQRSIIGHDPPEADSRNGYDDDCALGRSTAVEPGLLADGEARFISGSLAGRWLNPNVDQGNDDRPFMRFVVLDNTETEIFVDGDPTPVAEAGDLYAVGDGIVDDAALPYGFFLPLLGVADWPADAELSFFYGAFFSQLPSVRDMVPAWDEEAGDPDLLRFVVDKTEWYEDLDGNGRYDPGADVLHDADHAWGEFSFPADGRYQPYYLFLPDPTWGGLLRYGPGAAPDDRNNLTNLLLSAVLPLLAADAPGGGR